MPDSKGAGTCFKVTSFQIRVFCFTRCVTVVYETCWEEEGQMLTFHLSEAEIEAQSG